MLHRCNAKPQLCSCSGPVNALLSHPIIGQVSSNLHFGPEGREKDETLQSSRQLFSYLRAPWGFTMRLAWNRETSRV